MAEAGPDLALREYRLPGAIDLFVYPTGKFKTSLVSILLHRSLDEESSAAALVPYLLRRATRGHPDMASIARLLESLFGASFDVEVLRFGERQILSLRLDLVEERYLFMGGRDLLRKGLTLLRDVLAHPVLEDGRFPGPVFEMERTNLRRFVEGLVNDRGRYAFERCVRHMCAGEPYARFEYGAEEAIDRLTAEVVTKTWRQVLESSPIEVYVVGSTDPDRVRDLVASVFGGLRSGEGIRSPNGTVRKSPGAIRRVRETADVSQSRLVIGMRTEIGYGHPLSVPLAVWNALFGGGPFSRLFQHVREKHSLAYYCSSSLDQSKGLVFVQAGVEGAKAGKVERIIARQRADLAAGRISLDELRAVKAHIEAAVLSVTDSASRTTSYFQERRASETVMSFRELLDRISRVRRSEVVEAARTIRTDTVYLLTEGEA